MSLSMFRRCRDNLHFCIIMCTWAATAHLHTEGWGFLPGKAGYVNVDHSDHTAFGTHPAVCPVGRTSFPEESCRSTELLSKRETPCQLVQRIWLVIERCPVWILNGILTILVEDFLGVFNTARQIPVYKLGHDPSFRILFNSLFTILQSFDYMYVYVCVCVCIYIHIYIVWVTERVAK
jgi:hypothetical protein